MLRPMDQVEVAGGEGHFAPVLNPSDLNHIFKIFAVFIAFLGLVLSAICSPDPRAYKKTPRLPCCAGSRCSPPLVQVVLRPAVSGLMLRQRTCKGGTQCSQALSGPSTPCGKFNYCSHSSFGFFA